MPDCISDGLLDTSRDLPAEVLRHAWIFRGSDDDAADVAEALERVSGEDAVDWMKAVAAAVGLEVVGAPGEVFGEAVGDLVGVARLRQDALPHLPIRRMRDGIPGVARRRGHDDSAAWLGRRLDHPAEKAEARGDQCQDRVD